MRRRLVVFAATLLLVPGVAAARGSKMLPALWIQKGSTLWKLFVLVMGRAHSVSSWRRGI